ncbi:unnamed protein product, partial [Adineta steineri]
EWGPAKAIRHFNICPLTHFQAIFETHQLPITIKFRCPKQLKFHGKLSSNQYPSINHDHSIISNSATSNTLDKYVKYEYDEFDFIISFIIQLPHDGQYGIDLYARDPEYQTEKRTMSHCCKYVINYSKPPAVDPTTTAAAAATANNNNNNNNNSLYHDYSFDSGKTNGQQRMTSPRTNSTFNQSERSLSPRSSSSRDTNGSGANTSVPMPRVGGNTNLLSQFGMSPISHPDPSITLRSINTLELLFQIRKMVDFSFDLIYHHTPSDLPSRTPLPNLNQRLNASDYVTIKPNGGFNVIFALKLPKQGVYTFTIYAAATNHRNDVQLNSNGQTELPAVYTYLLRYI